MTQTALIARLRKVEEALEDAEDHLDFTGYGDSYERSCAREQKLPEQIEAALADIRELIKEAEEQEPIAEKLMPDPYDERDGTWLDLEAKKRLGRLPVGSKLYTALGEPK